MYNEKTWCTKTLYRICSQCAKIDAINILKFHQHCAKIYITTSFQLLWYTTADPECHNIHRNH